MIEILTSSTLNTIQDFGRPDAISLGVSRGGAMDRLALAYGNILLGNDPDAAGIEVVFFPFRIRFDHATSFALTGARTAATLDGTPLPPDWAMQARPGQILTIPAPTAGARCYVTLRGGVDVPQVLGSRSTDLKGGFGGLAARALRRGDQLQTLPVPPLPFPATGYGLTCPTPLPDGGDVVVRALPAAEYALFTAGSQDRFWGRPWKLTPSANRMGYRMEGTETLALDSPVNLFSHGILPGTVQVPPAGQPIVQMADANTCGGYPKIATVIEPDLRVLAQTAIGQSVRFIQITRHEAVEAIRLDARHLHALARGIDTLRPDLAPAISVTS